MRLQILLALCASAVAAVFGNTTHEILTHKHTFVYDGYGAKACSNLGGKDGKLMLEYTPSDHIRFNESDGKCLIPSNSFKVNGITCEGSTVQTDLVAVSLEDLDGKYGDDSAAEFDAFTAVLRDFETRANDIDELVGLFAQRGTPVQCAYRHGRENEPLFLANLVFIIVGSSQNFSSGLLPNSAAWLDADRLYIGVGMDVPGEKDGKGTLCTLKSQDPGPSSKSNTAAANGKKESKSPRFSDKAIMATSMTLAALLLMTVCCVVRAFRKRNFEDPSEPPSLNDPPTRVVEPKAIPKGYESTDVVLFAEEDDSDDIAVTKGSKSPH